MQGGVRAIDLAGALGLTKGRISQLVREGKLDGCYTGDGLHRRFDAQAAAAALDRSLDPGQMLGNGAATKRAIKAVLQGPPATESDKIAAPVPQPKGEAMAADDPDQYKLLREANAAEDLRAKRRNNAVYEGQYVLASEVEQQVARILAQVMAETEVFIKDVAQAIGDKLGIDKRQVRQIIVDAWRENRRTQAQHMASAADGADLTEAERAAQV